MRFHGNTQWTQEGDDVSTKKVFQAKRTTSGTFPAGSQWTRNPVPNCAGKHGGYYERDPTKCPYGLQFPAPAAGLFGQGENAWFEPVMNFPWTLYDQVRQCQHTWVMTTDSGGGASWSGDWRLRAQLEMGLWTDSSSLQQLCWHQDCQLRWHRNTFCNLYFPKYKNCYIRVLM